VVAQLTRDVMQRAEASGESPRIRPTAYIVDDNAASLALFAKMGWQRLCDCNWVGYNHVDAAGER
jgi:hypothetical protein